MSYKKRVEVEAALQNGAILFTTYGYPNARLLWKDKYYDVHIATVNSLRRAKLISVKKERMGLLFTWKGPKGVVI